MNPCVSDGDAASGAEIISLSGHTHRVWSIVVTADGKHAFSASFDRTVRMWRLPAITPLVGSKPIHPRLGTSASTQA